MKTQVGIIELTGFVYFMFAVPLSWQVASLSFAIFITFLALAFLWFAIQLFEIGIERNQDIERLIRLEHEKFERKVKRHAKRFGYKTRHLIELGLWRKL